VGEVKHITMKTMINNSSHEHDCDHDDILMEMIGRKPKM